MKDELIFSGYKAFKSKKGNDCYCLNFITLPKKITNGDGVYTTDVAVFCDKDKYSDFIKNNQLLSKVSVAFEIIGNRVKYFI